MDCSTAGVYTESSPAYVGSLRWHDGISNLGPFQTLLLILALVYLVMSLDMNYLQLCIVKHYKSPVIGCKRMEGYILIMQCN